MGDPENALHPSKKRAALRELTKDNPGLDDEEEVSEQETGTFKRASDEVLAGRRIVRVRRHQTPSTPSSNPFAAVRLVPSTATPTPVAEGGVDSVSKAAEEIDKVNKNVVEEKDGKDENWDEEDEVNSEPKVEEREYEIKSSEPKDEEREDKIKSTEPKEKEREVVESIEPKSEESAKYEEGANEVKEGAENRRPETEDKTEKVDQNVQKSSETASVSSFQQLSSSQNAFTGLAGTGFSSSTFLFGSISKTDQTSFPSFGFGVPSNGSPSLFANSRSSIADKNEASNKIPSMREVTFETGEENEKAIFTADSVLFEFLDGGWKERGKGELKVNVSMTGSEKARLVMRSRGNYRLILNSSLFPDMKLANMDKRGITFACINSSASDGRQGLSTFALKFKDASIVEEFRTVVSEHKGNITNPSAALKTPENSPKASDE